MVTENYIRYGKNRAPNLTQKSSFTHLQYPVHKEKMEMRRTEVFKLVIFLNIKKNDKLIIPLLNKIVVRKEI